MAEELNVRVSRLEAKVDEHSKSIERQVEKNDTLTRLVTLVELQTDINKKQTEQMDKFDRTLNKVNTNLDGLNRNLETLDHRVEKLESDDSDRKIDLGKLFKHILWTAIPTLIVTYLLIKFGMK